MIDLNKQLEEWLNAGIISTEQVDLMRQSVIGSPQEVDGSDISEGRIPIVTEILGYVGAALALWAVMFLVSEYWGNLSDWAQAALFGVVSLVLFPAGAAIITNRCPRGRLTSNNGP